jgi:hypothetical protein
VDDKVIGHGIILILEFGWRVKTGQDWLFLLFFSDFPCNLIDIIHDIVEVHGFEPAVIHDHGAIND